MLKLICRVGMLAGVLVAGFAAEESGQKSLLSVGDPAPPLQVGKWIQGGPIQHLENGKVYLVEFWATWCGPCRFTIPHINSIYKSFKDQGLNVMGIAIREEEQKDVPRFVKMMGSRMTYPVAVDDAKDSESGKMDAAWMNAAGIDALPTAFIINKDGLIAYLGNPLDLKEETIQAVLKDSLDLKAARASYIQKRENKGKIFKLKNEVEGAAAAKQWDKAEKLMDEIEKLTAPEDLDTLAVDRLNLILKMKDLPRAEKLAAELHARSQNDSRHQDQLAWTIAINPDATPALLAIAEKSAELARKITRDKDASVLETVARLQFVKGQKAAAIATQQKALDAADEDVKRRYKKVLDGYNAGKLPEE